MGREKETDNIFCTLNLYTLTASMYSTEGKSTLCPHLMPAWVDLQVFGDFNITKNLRTS